MKPIAWYDPSNGMVSTDQDCPLFTPLGQVWGLYPQRTWVGLTEEDYQVLREGVVKQGKPIVWMIEQIEAKLKEKNT
jgi:hypothetical protein